MYSSYISAAFKRQPPNQLALAVVKVWGVPVAQPRLSTMSPVFAVPWVLHRSRLKFLED